ncbi:cryptochrome/photolyase family protein [Asticcacaulis sp. AND118]|uniref:cryptochrome/photolyase family protein n=1 Tax=Asticcacaulis sp. AND118 TaxID=2840468 RepID=UPI001D0001DC|nr:cryptochrome/photolyase family protein [Asticcacaulis sp. AND118]UDF05115.1 cryptochrome/photolyase family protein [Asticcacaulis sp. AND118]
MSSIRLVLADQLSARLAIRSRADKDADVFLMAEVSEEATYARHHVKKIAFLFAAMRHYAEALKAAGYRVRYVRFDDPDNSHSLPGEIERARRDLGIREVQITEPGEWRLKQVFDAMDDVTLLEDDRFLCSTRWFSRWAEGRKQLRMEYFYREMRRAHGILMDGRQPCGGEWNYDAENRSPPREGLAIPRRLSFRKDAITREVLDMVAKAFPDNPGQLEPFHFAVTRSQALKELDHFVAHILPQFGTWQDAMLGAEPYMYHSLLSAYLNAGLLYPLEICQAAERAYRDGTAPLNAVEGFIRQILGWREYVRGLYWRYMPDYAAMNALEAHEDLPWFYWSGETQMNCVRTAVIHTLEHAYSHHIQRLMITGNFALLAGIDPRQVHDWYLGVYADAYEWVELPNTFGMALHADGGLMASKPYAASGAYINRMSDFCKDCHYRFDVPVGENACPFNALYWDFMARHEARFRKNPRLSYVYANWARMDDERQAAFRTQAQAHLQAMRDGRL